MMRRFVFVPLALFFSTYLPAAEPIKGLDRAKQLGGIYAIGKEACGIPESQLAAFKQQADRELQGNPALVAAYNQGLREATSEIRKDTEWLASKKKGMDCVPTRLLFAGAAMKTTN